MSSTISAARAALHTLLVAASANNASNLHGVQISFGVPDQFEEQRVVALLGLSDPHESTAAMGPAAKREEAYRIELAVKVYDPSADDPATVDAKGFFLADGVRNVIHDNVTLSGTVRTAYLVSQRTDGVAAPVDDAGKRLPGWVIRIDVSVECHARA